MSPIGRFALQSSAPLEPQQLVVAREVVGHDPGDLRQRVDRSIETVRALGNGSPVELPAKDRATGDRLALDDKPAIASSMSVLLCDRRLRRRTSAGGSRRRGAADRAAGAVRLGRLRVGTVGG